LDAFTGNVIVQRNPRGFGSSQRFKRFPLLRIKSPLVRRLGRKIEKNSATTGKTILFPVPPAGNTFSRPHGSPVIHGAWEQRNGLPNVRGGNDVAILYDTVGDDVFTGQKDGSSMWDQQGTYYVAALGFSTVRAYSSAGGYDVAQFYDSNLKDEFHFKPHKASLFDLVTNGMRYFIEARLFDRIFASAADGLGTDVAKIWDTTGDDCILASGTQLTMFRGSPAGEPLLGLTDFEYVKVRDSSSGSDRKEVHEPLLFDLVFGQGWL